MANCVRARAARRSKTRGRRSRSRSAKRGASNQQSPEENKQHLRRAKAKEARGETAQAEAEGRGGSKAHVRSGGHIRADLYRKARERDIPGRSKMSKSELERAVGGK